MNKRARIIAFYLPQYHPIPENDEWWGKGFTEWTNVAKAKPLFRGHYQPHVPADLGFYDLRVSETREAQANMAREYGIEAFCYYHYWFAGKRLMERPFNEVLESKKPDFPFCLCWANHSWTGKWAGCPGRTLIQQTYPSFQDHRDHFDFLLKAFIDSRYMTIQGKPVFLIYDPLRIPEINNVLDYWRERAIQSGLTGLYLIGTSWQSDWNPLEYGFDASTPKDLLPSLRRGVPKWNVLKWLKYHYEEYRCLPTVYQYAKVVSSLVSENQSKWTEYPCVIPNWDNTPRAGKEGLVLHESTPDLFRKQLSKAINKVKQQGHGEDIVFLKSWNEWAEGNHLEPDLKYGKAFLEVIRDEITIS